MADSGFRVTRTAGIILAHPSRPSSQGEGGHWQNVQRGFAPRECFAVRSRLLNLSFKWCLRGLSLRHTDPHGLRKPLLACAGQLVPGLLSSDLGAVRGCSWGSRKPSAWAVVCHRPRDTGRRPLTLVFSRPAETGGPLCGAPGRGPAHALHRESRVAPGGVACGRSGPGVVVAGAGACSACGLSSQDSQCGTVIDVSIDCAVKLIGTNCIIYPVNSKDLQHIWVSLRPLSLSSRSVVLFSGPECCPCQVSWPGPGPPAPSGPRCRSCL